MTAQQSIDKPVTITEEQLATIVELVLNAIAERQRYRALRLREAKLADLRAFEEMHDLPRAIPTRRDREG